MTPLGKPLVFHLKYMAEMNRIYGHEEGEEPDLTGLDDAQRVREMARTVGDAACEQVADFLELCGKGIEDHFTGLGIARLALKAKRATVVRNWDWYRRVHDSSRPGGSFYCGVFVSNPSYVRISVEKDTCGIVMPYLWLKGARQRKDAIWKILGGKPNSPGGVGLVKGNRTFVLACIPIKAQPLDSFDVDREQLIAEVIKTIARIGADQTKAIASFVAGLKDPDEN